MVRVPNAKGHAGNVACPAKTTHPRTRYQEHPERPFMNNLKERNPVPTSVQGSSEDPPGFIYPTYRAASTETQRDMPSLESPHQGVAYVSSSVGGSVSTLSFEETITKNQLGPPKRHGRGTRDRIRGFSRASRRNLLLRLASINRSAFRAFKGRIFFVTLTYPHEYPEDPELCKNHLKALRKRLQRKCGDIAGFWRLGIQGEARGISTCSCSWDRLLDQ
jgi:hypothetical protein